MVTGWQLISDLKTSCSKGFGDLLPCFGGLQNISNCGSCHNRVFQIFTSPRAKSHYSSPQCGFSCIQPQYTKQSPALCILCSWMKKGSKDHRSSQVFEPWVYERSPILTISPIVFYFKFYCQIVNWILTWPAQDLALHTRPRDHFKNEALQSRKNQQLQFISKSSLKAED